MNAANLLSYARRRAGLTQRDLADRSGTAQPAIARIEAGRVTPRTDTLRRLLAFCGYGLELRRASELDRSAIRQLLKLSPGLRLEVAAQEANNLAALA